eukprot:1549622-Pyramimonas_sp.AAC.1
MARGARQRRRWGGPARIQEIRAERQKLFTLCRSFFDCNWGQSIPRPCSPQVNSQPSPRLSATRKSGPRQKSDLWCATVGAAGRAPTPLLSRRNQPSGGPSVPAPQVTAAKGRSYV